MYTVVIEHLVQSQSTLLQLQSHFDIPLKSSILYSGNHILLHAQQLLRYKCTQIHYSCTVWRWHWVISWKWLCSISCDLDLDDFDLEAHYILVEQLLFLFTYSCNRTSGAVAIKHCYKRNHILIYRWNNLFDKVAITYCYTRNNFFATNALKSITVVLCDLDLESIDLMLHVFLSVLFKSRLSLIGISYVW